MSVGWVKLKILDLEKCISRLGETEKKISILGEMSGGFGETSYNQS